MLTREIIFMMKTMKKISVPKMEVIRFTTEDVIVTSGFSSLSAETPYFALGSEINEYFSYNGINSKETAQRFSTFSYKPESMSINIIQHSAYTEAQLKNSREFNNIYAWFDNGSWFTEGQTRTNYELQNGTYKWRYTN